MTLEEVGGTVQHSTFHPKFPKPVQKDTMIKNCVADLSQQPQVLSGTQSVQQLGEADLIDSASLCRGLPEKYDNHAKAECMISSKEDFCSNI